MNIRLWQTRGKSWWPVELIYVLVQSWLLTILLDSRHMYRKIPTSHLIHLQLHVKDTLNLRNWWSYSNLLIFLTNAIFCKLSGDRPGFRHSKMLTSTTSLGILLSIMAVTRFPNEHKAMTDKRKILMTCWADLYSCAIVTPDDVTRQPSYPKNLYIIYSSTVMPIE